MQSQAALKKQLKARTRELAEAREHLAEALEQQTATSEVLRVISSSPGELEPVFQAMLENATRICEAKFGNLCLCEGDAFRIVAHHNTPPALAEARRREPLIRPAAGRRLLGAWSQRSRSVHVADFAAEQAYVERDPALSLLVELGGARTLLVVPMLKEES